jgi:hypothetical protein
MAANRKLQRSKRVSLSVWYGPIVTDAAPCTFRHEGRILLKNSGVGRSGQIQQNSILVISNLTYFSWHILAIGEQFSAF